MSSEEEESFDFSKLPLDLQTGIVEKFEYYQNFSYFDQTSKLGHAVCSSRNYSIFYYVPTVNVNKKRTNISLTCRYDEIDLERQVPWHVASRSPIRIDAQTVVIRGRLKSGSILKASRLFRKNRTQVQHLLLQDQVSFSSEALDVLLKATRPWMVSCDQFLPREYFNCPSLQAMQNLHFVSTGCTDEDLVKLKADGYLHMRSDFITSKGLNNLLKQWKRKEREIERINIEFGSTFTPPRIDEILKGVEANPVWTPEYHNDSILRVIPMEQLSYFTPYEPEYIYSMWRPDMPEKTVFIRLTNELIDIWTDSNEAQFLLRWLNYDEYYLVKNECAMCSTQFCNHRRKYSSVQLKKQSPNLYNALMFGFRVMGVLSASLRTLSYFAGERPFSRISLYEYHEVQLEETLLSKIVSLLRVHLLDQL